MTEQFANFSQSSLAAPITASQTIISVASPSTFPTLGNFRIVVQSFDVTTQTPTSAPELMLVTAVSGKQFTVQRGIENTQAIAFASGAQVTHIVTAGVMQALAAGGGGGTGSSLTKSITQTSHGFSVGNVIRLNGTSTYAVAQADSVSDAEAIGIVSTVTDANNFVLTTGGYVTGLSGLTANTVYFLDPSVAGGLTATQPVAVGQVNKPIFISDTATSGYLINYRGELITAGMTNILIGRSSTIINAMSTGSTQIPADDTIPQNTEGDQYMTLSYTPQNTNNILEIVVSASLATLGATTATLALYQDSTANALAATATTITTVNQINNLTLQYSMTAGTTSATIFKVRMGPSSATTLTFNGVNGVRRYGGISASSIFIKETSI